MKFSNELSSNQGRRNAKNVRRLLKSAQKFIKGAQKMIAVVGVIQPP